MNSALDNLEKMQASKADRKVELVSKLKALGWDSYEALSFPPADRFFLWPGPIHQRAIGELRDEYHAAVSAVESKAAECRGK
jgi:LmbE family N-acetylglucosaminyl deacetylase